MSNLAISRRRQLRTLPVATLALLAAATAAQGQQYALQKSNSISLSSQFFGGATRSQYGTNPLSVTFDGTNAYVGGYNNSGTAGSTGVVRFDNILGAAPVAAQLTGSGAIVPTASFRGIDHLAAFGGDVIMAHTTGNPATSFIRRINGTSGATVWNTLNPAGDPSGNPPGLQPFAMAIDPRIDGGAPGVGFISQDDFSGYVRFGLKLSDGSLLGASAGVANSSGRFLGYSPRDMSFDSQGNLATITGTGVGYARRAGNDAFVNDITGTGGGAGSAGVLTHQGDEVNNNGNAVAILEGAGVPNFIAASIRVKDTNSLTLTDFTGATQPIADARDVQIRNLNGTLAGLTQTKLQGDEDFLGSAYNGQIKGLATGRDANNNPVLFVVDFVSNVLDVYQIEPAYTGTAGGAWDSAANWQLGLIADGATQNARFGPSASAQTITLDSPRTTKLLKLEGANAYTLAGPGTLTLDAPVGKASNISVTGGSHRITAAVTVAKDLNVRIAAGSALEVTSQIAAQARGITKRGAGTLTVLNLRASAVNLAEGAVTIRANGTGTGISRVGTLALSGGTIDLTDNSLIVDYGTTETTPFATLKAAILNPAGAIRSSSAAADASTILGIGEGSAVNLAALNLPAGVTADATSVIIRFTLKGDANLDRTVNFADLVTLAQNYNRPSGAEFTQGDSNYDGAVNFADLVALAQNYNDTAPTTLASLTAAGAAESFVGDWQLAQSLVPEPGTLALVALAAGGAMRRRRQPR